MGAHPLFLANFYCNFCTIWVFSLQFILCMHIFFTVRKHLNKEDTTMKRESDKKSARRRRRHHFDYLCPTMITCVFFSPSCFVLARDDHYFLQFGVWICSEALWRFRDRRKKNNNCLYLTNHDSLLFFLKQVLFVGQTWAFLHQPGVWVSALAMTNPQ